MSVNKLLLVGNLGKDPELKSTASGQKFCDISVATEEYAGKQDGQSRYETQWHNVRVWGNQADFAAKAKKGQTVFVTTALRTNKAEDGRIFVNLNAVEFQILSRNTSGGGSSSNETSEPAGQDQASAPAPSQQASRGARSTGAKAAATAPQQQAIESTHAAPAVDAGDDDLPF